MSPADSLIVVLAATLALFVLNQVRKGVLYVGYGVLFVAGAVGLGVGRTLWGVVPGRATLVDPETTVILLFAAVAFLFVYVLSQLTIANNRIARVVQELALRTPPACDRQAEANASASRPGVAARVEVR